MVFGGPLLGDPDRQARSSIAGTLRPPPPVVHRQLADRVSRHQLHHDQVALCVARLNARTRSAAHAVRGARIRYGPAVRRRRVGEAPRSVHPVNVIPTNQTSQPWDVSTALQDVSSVPERPQRLAGLSACHQLQISRPPMWTRQLGRFYGVLGPITGLFKTSKTSKTSKPRFSSEA